MTMIGKSFREKHLETSAMVETGLEPVTFVKCFFSGSVGARISRPQDRLVIKNIRADECSIGSVTVGPVIFENVRVDGLETRGHLRLPGCVFRRCELRGRIGSILNYENARLIEPWASTMNQTFFADTMRIYAQTDWALDISDANFEDLDLRGVPADLIRVREREQIRVRYEAATTAFERDDLRISEYARTLLGASLKHRQMTCMDFVLVTNSSREEYSEMLELFGVLRDVGATF